MARDAIVVGQDVPTKDVLAGFKIEGAGEYPGLTYTVMGTVPVMEEDGVTQKRNVFGTLLYRHVAGGCLYDVSLNAYGEAARARMGEALGGAAYDLVARTLAAMGVAFDPADLAAGVQAVHATGENIVTAVYRALEAIEADRIATSLGLDPHVGTNGKGVPPCTYVAPEPEPAPAEEPVA